MLDFRDVDKSKFECWQMDGGSVYFGLTAYVDQDNKLVANIEEAKKYLEEQHKEGEPEHAEGQALKFKRIRHGLGINLYGRTEGEETLCRYEGKWDKDKKHGEGFLVFPDGSTYQGSFKNDIIEGYGLFIWKNKGHKYEGNWRDGRMEGGGEFTHSSGTKYKGQFFLTIIMTWMVCSSIRL